MIFDVENTEGKKVIVRDELGKRLAYVTRYDTDTRMARLFLVAGVALEGNPPRPLFVVDGERVAQAEVHLPNSTIEVDGVRY